jgi:nitroreductase
LTIKPTEEGGPIDTPIPSYDAVRELVELASRAPSVHNTQPWRWCWDVNRLNLYADRSRHLSAADPDARDLLLSCGAALHHLTVAAAAHGWKSRIRRMPTVLEEDHLATVTFEQYDATDDDRTVLDALRARRTDRRRPSSWPVPLERLEPMVDLAARAGALALPVTTERGRARLLELTLEATEIQRNDPAYQAELGEWVGHSTEDGVPWTSLPVHSSSPDTEHVDRRPLVKFPPGSMLESEEEEAESGAAFIVLATSSDDRTSQLRVGEALSAILLRGAEAGVSMVPLSAALEVAEIRKILQDELLDDVAFPQAVIQIGWQPIANPDIPPTPRRPVDEVLSPSC